MAVKTGLNPFCGREQDVLCMCEHFLEDDRVKDQPKKYHKKLAILTETVMLLKHLYGDELDLNYLVRFLTQRDIIKQELDKLEKNHQYCDREELRCFCYKLLNNDDYIQVVGELVEELNKLPH